MHRIRVVQKLSSNPEVSLTCLWAPARNNNNNNSSQTRAADACKHLPRLVGGCSRPQSSASAAAWVV